MVWTIIYSIVVITGLLSFILLLKGKLIPKETKKRLKDEELSIYRKNLVLVSLYFSISGALLLIQHILNVNNILIYLVITLLAWYAIKKLSANIVLLNK